MATIELDYAVYDAFATQAFGGSPAALVAGAEILTAEQMQRIAQEFAAPATGFITGFDGETVDVRFFSTQTEYPMCGHGTIALASWLADRGDIDLASEKIKMLTLRTPTSKARLELCGSDTGRPRALLGLLAAEFERFTGDVAEVNEILGANPEQLLTSPAPAITYSDFNHLILAFGSLAAVDELSPNFSALSAYCRTHSIDTIMVYSLETDNQAYTLHCREFAPAVGTNEVAATGTTNRALACYLHDYQVLAMPKSGTFTILAEQGYAMQRPSIVRSDVNITNGQIESVNVGGVATKVMQGTLTLTTT